MGWFRDRQKKKKNVQAAQEAVMSVNPDLQKELSLSIPVVAQAPANEGTTAVERAYKASSMQAAQEMPQSPATSAVEIYKRLHAHMAPISAEDKAKIEKRARSQKTLSMIGDVISNLANVYAASQGAPAAKLPSLTAAWRERYDKAVEDRKANEEAYARGVLQAQAQDNANRLAAAKARIEEQKYKDERELEDRKFYANENQREWERSYKEAQAKANEEKAIREYNEKVRSNKKKEEISEARAKAYGEYLGNKYSSSKVDKTDEPFRMDDGSMIYIPQKAYANKVPEFYQMILNNLSQEQKTELGIYGYGP